MFGSRGVLPCLCILCLVVQAAHAEDPAATWVELKARRAEVAGTAEEHSVLLAMSDLLWDNRSWGKLVIPDGEDEMEMGVACLDEAMRTEVYSGSLAKAWQKWRFRKQLYWHGASRWSEIPNGEYDAARNHLIGIVRARLQERPDDGQAKAQLGALAGATGLRRMGVGNDEVEEWIRTGGGN